MRNSDQTTSSRQPLISQFNGKGLLYAFVYRTAQRRILSELKRRDRAGVSIDGIDIAITPETESAALNDLRTSLAKMLQSLSDRERIVLRMTCEGYSNSEIAAVITTPGKSPIHDGRISHIRNGIVTHLRRTLEHFADSIPNGSTLISDLLGGSIDAGEIST